MTEATSGLEACHELLKKAAAVTALIGEPDEGVCPISGLNSAAAGHFKEGFSLYKALHLTSLVRRTSGGGHFTGGVQNSSTGSS